MDFITNPFKSLMTGDSGEQTRVCRMYNTPYPLPVSPLLCTALQLSIIAQAVAVNVGVPASQVRGSIPHLILI